MKVFLIQHYGNLKRSEGVKYKVIEEGYDWFLLSNGYYVPKFLCRF